MKKIKTKAIIIFAILIGYNLNSSLVLSQEKYPYELDQLISSPKRFEVPGFQDFFAVTFSKDGNTFYVNKFGINKAPGTNPTGAILESHFENGTWQKPKPLGFSMVKNTHDEAPFLSPDGKKLYFNSDRPAHSGNFNIYYSERTDTGWSQAHQVKGKVNTSTYMEVSPAVASDGTLYFSRLTPPGGNGNFYYSRLLPNGEYDTPKLLSDSINSEYDEWGLYISPDQNLILFMSNRPGGYGKCDIYFSIKINGIWSKARNLGPKINTPDDEIFSCISPDGKYLFFSRFETNGASIYYLDWKPLLDSLTGVSAQSWKQCKPIPEGMSPATVIIGNKIYLFNSSHDLNKAGSLYEYDISKNSWKEKTRMSVARCSFSLIGLNGKIYVIGGIVDSLETPTSLVEEYDPVKDKWQVKNPMPTARNGMGTCIYKDKIYTFGGYTRKEVQTDIIEIYDPKTDNWTKKSSLPQQMAYGSPILINNTMYMPYKDGFYKYDPRLDKWTGITSSHKVNNCLTMRPILVDDKIYAICGEFINRKGIACHLVKYDPLTDTWENLKDLFKFKMDYGFKVLKGKIYVFGGWSEDYRKALNACEMYDIKTDTWKRLPNMSVPRLGMGIEMFNDSIFILGGIDGFKYDQNDRSDVKNTIFYDNVEVLRTAPNTNHSD